MNIYLGTITYLETEIKIYWSIKDEGYEYKVKSTSKNIKILEEWLDIMEQISSPVVTVRSEGYSGTSFSLVMYKLYSIAQCCIQKGRELLTTKDNPFDGETVLLKHKKIHGVSQEKKVELLMSSIDENRYLDPSQKELLKTLDYYLKQAPSLDFRRLYEILRTVRMKMFDLHGVLDGSYGVWNNLLSLDIECYETEFYHEFIHLITNHKKFLSCGLQCGDSVGYNSTEAMADLISGEYYRIPVLENYHYYYPALMISMLCEIIDPELFHVANNTGKLENVFKELRLLRPDLNPIRLFALSDYIGQLDKLEVNVSKESLIYELLHMIEQYYEAQFNESMKENEVMRTYGNMFLEDATIGVFVPHFNQDLKEMFPNPVYYKYGSYSIDKIIEFQKQKKVV